MRGRDTALADFRIIASFHSYTQSMRARMEASAAGGAEPSAGSSWRGDRDETQNVRVTNLSEDAEEQDLHALFKRFGPIQRIYIARDRETDLCKGFAFISFYNRDDGAKAIEVMNGYGFDNLILNVSWAAPK